MRGAELLKCSYKKQNNCDPVSHPHTSQHAGRAELAFTDLSTQANHPSSKKQWNENTAAVMQHHLSVEQVHSAPNKDEQIRKLLVSSAAGVAGVSNLSSSD